VTSSPLASMSGGSSAGANTLLLGAPTLGGRGGR
jgi:hypothetical protein